MVEPVPTKPTRQYGFEAFQIANPTTPLPGNQVDSEVDQTNEALADVIDFVRQAIDDDGKIKAEALTNAPAGPAGPQGETGATGPQGPQGVEGPQGATGPQGIQGVQGIQGIAGDSFAPDAIGPETSQSLYDAEPAGFAFLDATNGILYFKLSNASGDWSMGVMFGRGPQGPIGPQGIQGIQGEQGIQGVQGETGPQGLTGNTGATGTPGMDWEGAYSGATAYAVDDVVQYLGSSYICILASTGNAPPNATYWQLVASKGDQGEQGIQGIQGIQGATGATGADGAQGPAGPTGPAGPEADIAGQINAATNKATPVSADKFGFWDSVSSALRQLTWSQLLTALFTGPTISNANLTGAPVAPTPSAGDNDTSVATTAYVQTELYGVRGTNAQTGTTYTFVLTDAGKLVTGNNAAAQTFTVPPNSSVAYPIRTVINLGQLGAGQLAIAAGAGVTIRSSGSKLKMTGQYSAASLVKIGTDEWMFFGDIAA